MQDFSSWADHLKHPLVLVGFIVMVFAGIVHALLNGKEGYSEGLIKKSLLYVFILSIVVIVLGFAFAFKNGAQKAGYGEKIIQGEKEERSTLTGRDKETDSSVSHTSRHIEQKTDGNQSPVVVSGGEVNISFENK